MGAKKTVVASRLVRVYNISKMVEEKLGGEFGLLGKSTIIIIEGPDGIIISDDEGVHNIFPNRDAQLKLHLYKVSEGEMSLIPTHSLQPTVQQMLEEKHEDKELGQAVRRFGSRIESNYEILLKAIEKIGLNPNDFPRGEIKK